MNEVITGVDERAGVRRGIKSLGKDDTHTQLPLQPPLMRLNLHAAPASGTGVRRRKGAR